jgi:hypothetical protein
MTDDPIDERDAKWEQDFAAAVEKYGNAAAVFLCGLRPSLRARMEYAAPDDYYRPDKPEDKDAK